MLRELEEFGSSNCIPFFSLEEYRGVYPAVRDSKCCAPTFFLELQEVLLLDSVHCYLI